MTTPYAPGKHVLLDMFGATHLDDADYIESALVDVAHICGATVLETKLHSFGEGQGVTGVVLLAESHISIHTWPETGFTAIDIFMCGSCNAMLAVQPLLQYFTPTSHTVKQVLRGQ